MQIMMHLDLACFDAIECKRPNLEQHRQQLDCVVADVKVVDAHLQQSHCSVMHKIMACAAR